MNIAIIVKTDLSAEEFTTDWVPGPLGNKSLIYKTLAGIMNISVDSDEFKYDKQNTLLHFTVDKEDEPRYISVSYGSGEKELEILHSICNELGAKLYDSEMCEFI